MADSSKNIFLRFSQYDAYQNMETRLQIAKNLIFNKIENQMQVIRKYRFKDGFSPRNELEKMKKLQSGLFSCATSNARSGGNVQ